MRIRDLAGEAAFQSIRTTANFHKLLEQLTALAGVSKLLRRFARCPLLGLHVAGQRVVFFLTSIIVCDARCSIAI